jgi:beta-galactosidase
MQTGICYYPEHWPRERWATDIARMARTGLEYVRLGEFSWARLEPSPGEFDLEWLDTVLDLLAEHDLRAVLCTPTATPPKWLVDRHPDIRQREPDGTIREFGSRRHYCFNSETYLEQSDRIVEVLASRFAEKPAVVGWQTDNEYGCHGTARCYCTDCTAAFREWLAGKYGDIEALNEAWGNDFWSQSYSSFAAIDPPRHTPAHHHPSRLLEYARFSSDSVVAFNERQATRLREANEEWFITHNFMGDFTDVDARAVSETLDFASWDSYPTGFPQWDDGSEPTIEELRVGDADQVGMNHDLYRAAGDAPFWVAEQQVGEVDWTPYSPQPGPGAVRLWTHYAAAHGADTVCYFRWRRPRAGQEQYLAGLSTHDGRRTRGHAEAKRATAELDALGDLPPVAASVAILHDYENLWALNAQPDTPDFGYWWHLRTYYRALRARGVTTDIVHPTADLDRYAAIVAPTLHLVDDALAARLRSYVEKGGTLLVTIRSGVKDEYNGLSEGPAPGPLAPLVGAWIEERETLPKGVETSVTYQGDRYPVRTWGERLAAEEATIMGRHTGGIVSGRAAITSREVGEGTVTYCGVWPSEDLAEVLVGRLCERAWVDPIDPPLPWNVRLAHRGPYTWIFNWTDGAIELDGPTDWTAVIGSGQLSAYDLAVFETDIQMEGN